MSLIKNHQYRWTEILTALRADDTPPPFALHRGDVVVGFALNRWQNPQAPTEILVGYGEDREKMVESFITHRPTVWVLIKEAKDDSQWRCAGKFQIRDWTEDAGEKNKRVTPFDIPAIYKILFMEEVTA